MTEKKGGSSSNQGKSDANSTPSPSRKGGDSGRSTTGTFNDNKSRPTTTTGSGGPRKK